MLYKCLPFQLDITRAAVRPCICQAFLIPRTLACCEGMSTSMVEQAQGVSGGRHWVQFPESALDGSRGSHALFWPWRKLHGCNMDVHLHTCMCRMTELEPGIHRKMGGGTTGPWAKRELGQSLAVFPLGCTWGQHRLLRPVLFPRYPQQSLLKGKA